MNPEVKEKWIAALESGEYKQGTAVLCQPDESDPNTLRWCCLGVLCDLAVREGVIPEPRILADGTRAFGPFGDSAYLPNEVAEWAGVPHTNRDGSTIRPLVNVQIGDYTATELNDRLKRDFNEIAAQVREYL